MRTLFDTVSAIISIIVVISVASASLYIVNIQLVALIVLIPVALVLNNIYKALGVAWFGDMTREEEIAAILDN